MLWIIPWKHLPFSINLSKAPNAEIIEYFHKQLTITVWQARKGNSRYPFQRRRKSVAVCFCCDWEHLLWIDQDGLQTEEWNVFFQLSQLNIQKAFSHAYEKFLLVSPIDQQIKPFFFSFFLFQDDQSGFTPPSLLPRLL